MLNWACWVAGSPLTVGDQMVAGMGAGVAVSFLACPTELLKCRLQAQGDAAKSGDVRSIPPLRKWPLYMPPIPSRMETLRTASQRQESTFKTYLCFRGIDDIMHAFR